MAEETSQTRATIASVDQRVASLEAAQALIQLEQSHLRELMQSRFTAIEVSLSTQGAKLDGFITRIESMVLEATRNSGDLTSSPAGRLVHERLTTLETQSKLDASFLDQMRGMGTAMKFVIGTSGVSAVLAILSILRVSGVIGT